MARMSSCVRSAWSARSVSVVTGFLCLVLMSGAPALWATPGLTFQGVVNAGHWKHCA